MFPGTLPGTLGTTEEKSVSAPPARKLTARIWLLWAARLAINAVRVVLMAEILLFFTATGLANFKDVHEYRAFARVLAFQTAVERPAAELVKRLVPTNFKGTDISRWLFVYSVYKGAMALGRGAAALEEAGAYALRRREAAEPGAGELAALAASLKAIARDETLDRRMVLQIYAEAKKTLESQKRHLAFLSIDIVNSTGMKVGETRETAERDFILYKKLVERALKTHRALKSTWTPDGVMICFGAVDGAVGAGVDIVRALKDFNRNVKSMKHDFALRIGINAGEVSYDETLPMEEMTDRVIDIAGHMQKHGTIDAVCITKAAIEPFLDRFEFKPAGRVVDGCEVYEWREDSPA